MAGIEMDYNMDSKKKKKTWQPDNLRVLSDSLNVFQIFKFGSDFAKMLL